MYQENYENLRNEHMLAYSFQGATTSGGHMSVALKASLEKGKKAKVQVDWGKDDVIEKDLIDLQEQEAKEKEEIYQS